MSAALKVAAGEPAVEPAVEPVRPLRAPDLTPAAIGALPELKWLPVTALRINRGYQRDLSRSSIELIRRIVANWDWSRLKALSVLDMGDGTFEVVDGQHTAVAAMTHGQVRQLPCLIAPARGLPQAAADFVGLNRDRVGLTPLQIFWARVAAGEEEANEVARGVALGGGRIPRTQVTLANMREGDCVATSALEALAKEGGAVYVKRVIGLGVAARLRPVGRDFIGAMRAVIWGGYAGKISDERIVDLIRVRGMTRLLTDARLLRDDQGGSIGAALAAVFARLA